MLLAISTGLFSVWMRLRRNFRSKYATHFGTQLSGDSVCVNSITNDLRSDKDDQLSPLHASRRTREQICYARNLIESWNSFATTILALADQTSKQHSLSARDRN